MKAALLPIGGLQTCKGTDTQTEISLQDADEPKCNKDMVARQRHGGTAVAERSTLCRIKLSCTPTPCDIQTLAISNT